MLSKERVAALHRAAKVIEQDGVDGIRYVTKLVGEDAAMALLIAHIRRQLGSNTSFPSMPVEGEVNNRLIMNGLMSR